MSPSKREREYARRRYEKWQGKLSVRQARRRKLRRNLLVAASVVGVVAVIGVVWALIANRDPGTTTATAADSPQASASGDATANSTAGATSSSAASSTAVSNPCPAPGPKATAKPQSWPTPPPDSTAAGKTWTVVFDTSCGPITLSLDGAKAPKAVSSTLFLAKNHFWDNTPCHRLTTEGIFVLQCGDPTGSGTGGPGYSYGPVENAPANNVYPAGTVAMARQQANGSSMGSQFFLVYKDSTIPSDSGGGYTVMGKIVGGMDIVEKIAAGGLAPNGIAPARAISITGVSVADG